jgi:hypothetical protein
LYETDKLSKDYGKLFLHCPTFGNVDEYVISYFDSVQQMILTLVEYFETGALVYSNENMSLEENYENSRIIVKKYNLKSEYWQR